MIPNVAKSKIELIGPKKVMKRRMKAVSQSVAKQERHGRRLAAAAANEPLPRWWKPYGSPGQCKRSSDAVIETPGSPQRAGRRLAWHESAQAAQAFCASRLRGHSLAPAGAHPARF